MVQNNNFDYSLRSGKATMGGHSSYSVQPIRKNAGSTAYSTSGSYISKAGRALYKTSAAELHSTNHSAMSYSSGSYSHNGGSNSYSSSSYASVNVPSLASTTFSWNKKDNGNTTIGNPRKVIHYENPQTEGGKTYYYDDEEEEWIEANNPNGDTSKDGDYEGQISLDGQYRWDGSKWVNIGEGISEVDNPVGNLPVLMMLIFAIAYCIVRNRLRSQKQ